MLNSKKKKLSVIPSEKLGQKVGAKAYNCSPANKTKQQLNIEVQLSNYGDIIDTEKSVTYAAKGQLF